MEYLDFLDFLQKFYNIDYRVEKVWGYSGPTVKESYEWTDAAFTSGGRVQEYWCHSVTRKKSPNVYKSSPKMIWLEKW